MTFTDISAVVPQKYKAKNKRIQQGKGAQGQWWRWQVGEIYPRRLGGPTLSYWLVSLEQVKIANDWEKLVSMATGGSWNLQISEK